MARLMVSLPFCQELGTIAKIVCDIGRAFTILPRQIKPEGYADIDHDDMKEGTFLHFF